MKCKCCEKEFVPRHKQVFCSSKCRSRFHFEYNRIINQEMAHINVQVLINGKKKGKFPLSHFHYNIKKVIEENPLGAIKVSFTYK